VSLEQILVDSFMLADAAHVFEGKLFVYGGGWNFLKIVEPGVARSITVVGRIIVPWQDTERELMLTVSLEHREADVVLERTPIFRLGMRSQARPDQPISLETATPFSFEIPGIVFLHPGEYIFVIEHEGKELARTRFQVNFADEYDEASAQPETTAAPGEA
jgi:hypothetical protein